MSRPPFTFYEFFAGAGMARLGLGPGWECVFANDFDPVKADAYAANFGDGHLHRGDVFDIDAARLPGAADLAWASSPCQDFSLAGGRAGLAGGRSSAFLGFWRLIAALNAEGRAPRLVVIENVPGLLTSHGGRDFEAICRALHEEDYRFGAVELDAAAFLPQSRRRVFLVGARDAIPPPSVAGGGSKAVEAARDRLPPALRSAWMAWGAAPISGARNADLVDVLEPDDAVAWRSEGQTARLISLMDARNRARLDVARAAGERRVGTVCRRVRAGAQRAEARFDGLAGCLRTPGGGSSRQFLLVVEGAAVRSRLITPRESARLMGLPDDFRLPATTTAALRVTGDGVAAPAVRWLAETVLEPALSAVHKRISKQELAA